jgi:hypothetical protein
VRVCACACVRACVRARACACVCACVCVCVCVRARTGSVGGVTRARNIAGPAAEAASHGAQPFRIPHHTGVSVVIAQFYYMLQV